MVTTDEALLLLPIEEIGGAEPEEVDDGLDLRCPRCSLEALSLSTGKRIPLRCRANFCWYCGPRNAVGIAVAQARSEPQRSIRFSKLPHDWDAIRLGMKQVVEALRDAGARWEMAWSVEPNPSGEPMCHAHALQHGDYVDQRWLQVICERNGLGIPYIERVRSGQAAASYGIKAAGAAWYGLKMARSEDAGHYRHFLTVNGGRLSHHTRGFYRVEGEPATQGAAIEALRRERLADEEGPWVVVKRGRSVESARRIGLRAAGTPSASAPR